MFLISANKRAYSFIHSFRIDSYAAYHVDSEDEHIS